MNKISGQDIIEKILAIPSEEQFSLFATAVANKT
jgi:hypothetical protein